MALYFFRSSSSFEAEKVKDQLARGKGEGAWEALSVFQTVEVMALSLHQNVPANSLYTLHVLLS